MRVLRSYNPVMYNVQTGGQSFLPTVYNINHWIYQFGVDKRRIRRPPLASFLDFNYIDLTVIIIFTKNYGVRQ